MAKQDTEQSNQLNLTVVALVALVAIVGLVALVMNTASIASFSAESLASGGQLVTAEPTGTDANLVGDAYKCPAGGCGQACKGGKRACEECLAKCEAYSY